jgi:hypothetical protein
MNHLQNRIFSILYIDQMQYIIIRIPTSKYYIITAPFIWSIYIGIDLFKKLHKCNIVYYNVLVGPAYNLGRL